MNPILHSQKRYSPPQTERRKTNSRTHPQCVFASHKLGARWRSWGWGGWGWGRGERRFFKFLIWLIRLHRRRYVNHLNSWYAQNTLPQVQQLMLSTERRLFFIFIFHFHSSYFQLKKIMGIRRRQFRGGHFSGEYQPAKKIKITKRENGKRCTFSFEASTTDSPKLRDFLRCKRAWKDRQSLWWLQTSDNTRA